MSKFFLACGVRGDSETQTLVNLEILTKSKIFTTNAEGWAVTQKLGNRFFSPTNSTEPIDVFAVRHQNCSG